LEQDPSFAFDFPLPFLPAATGALISCWTSFVMYILNPKLGKTKLNDISKQFENNCEKRFANFLCPTRSKPKQLATLSIFEYGRNYAHME
jgi:hypothetical protein